MSCQHNKQKIIEYLDGEISKKEKETVEFLLSSCEECKAFLKEQEQILQLMDAYEGLEPSADFTKKVISKVFSARAPEKEKAKIVPLIRLLWKPLSAAAAIIIIALSIYAFIPKNQDEKLISQLDVVQNMDILENLDLLLEWDTIQDNNFSNAENLI